MNPSMIVQDDQVGNLIHQSFAIPIQLAIRVLGMYRSRNVIRWFYGGLIMDERGDEEVDDLPWIGLRVECWSRYRADRSGREFG